MSKETYINGFCKAAVARGVDPEKLAQSMTKKALSMADVKKLLSGVYGKARSAWRGVNDEYKPLVGGLIGGTAGAGLGAAGGALTGIGAGKGALAGFGLGGLGGSLYGARSAHLKSVANALEAKKSHRKEVGALSDANNAALAKAKSEGEAALAKAKNESAAEKGRMEDHFDSAYKALSRQRSSDLEKMKKRLNSQAEAHRKALEAISSSYRDLQSENKALRDLGDVLGGMTMADWNSKTPEEQKAIIGRALEQRDKLNAVIAGAGQAKLLKGLVPATEVNTEAQEWFDRKQRERRDSEFRKAEREADKEVEREAKNREATRNAPYFNWTMPR